MSKTPKFDLLIRNVRLEQNGPLVDLAINSERIAGIGSNLMCDAGDVFDGEGAFAFPGFVETHIHLDKAGILSRCSICEGTLGEAVRETAKAKAAFTEEDVYARAAKVVESAIVSGTTRLRTFVEVDPRAGLRSFAAIKRIREDYAFAIDIEICAFAQEGLTNERETYQLLETALGDGADLVGGAPYVDPDPEGHIAMIFDLAERFKVAVDFHLDFDLDPQHTDLPAVIRETEYRGYAGHVSIGHVTNISAMKPNDVRAVADKLRDAGIALTVLPATDMFLNGRAYDHLVPRGIAPAHVLSAHGVLTSIASNNILNPFTPYGDASLARMANFYANVAQLSRSEDLQNVFDMVSRSAAALLGKAYSVRVGGQADIVLLDCSGPEEAIRIVARPLAGWKRGRKSFEAPKARIFPEAVT
ncbi:amidohydrolase family protein [Rhizobium sp. L1K21]|uniref:amidohydrolase family protein n=1 Tax=Rhizobium sp. L1K21 TaxID=2954933 RepID=UPI002091F831|nr:amidohydrolase family protein [Rhizobium sp. L1K21]MCO6188651.1 amidohydrolase family protein [Rhizobium sp. L1K21]